MTGIVYDLRSDEDGLALPGTPWRIRFAAGTRGRAALEIHQGEELLDVLVADGLAPAALCGARRTGTTTLAWGCLLPDGTAPALLLRRPGRMDPGVRFTGHPAGAAFWLAVVPGSYTRAALPRTGEWLRVRKAR